MRVALTFVGADAQGSVILLYSHPLRLIPHRLVATDILHAIPLVCVAELGYLFIGLVDGDTLLSLLVGSAPPVILGSLLRGKISGRWIQIALAIVLATVGTKVPTYQVKLQLIISIMFWDSNLFRDTQIIFIFVMTPVVMLPQP